MAFVLDEFGELARQCNTGMVDLAPVAGSRDRELLRHLVEQHARYTGSARAKRELGQWDRALRNFVAVIPREYRKAIGTPLAAEDAVGKVRRGRASGEARHG
jgi:glutamate synthase domain-containing protein 3